MGQPNPRIKRKLKLKNRRCLKGVANVASPVMKLLKISPKRRLVVKEVRRAETASPKMTLLMRSLLKGRTIA